MRWSPGGHLFVQASRKLRKRRFAEPLKWRYPALGEAVTVSGEETGYTQKTTTNGEGFCVLHQLVVGTYRVAVEVNRFRTVMKTRIGSDVDETRVVDFQLHIGSRGGADGGPHRSELHGARDSHTRCHTK